MTRRHSLGRLVLATIAALSLARGALAAEAGLVVPASSEAGDQRRGHVLFFNLFTSNEADPSIEDTRVTITNEREDAATFLRLFFVHGADGLVAGSFLCLTAMQTASFQASDLLPGFRGFLIAVTIDPITGCPASTIGYQTRLSGQAHVKMNKFEGTLPAVAASGLYNGVLAGCDLNSVTANIPFNGLSFGYTRLPRVVQADAIGSSADGAKTQLVLNRVTGDLAGGLASIGSLNGTLLNQAGSSFGYTLSSTRTQLMGLLRDVFPVTVPPFSTVIPAGQTGWTKLNNAVDTPLLGAAFVKGGGAVNLRARTLSDTAVLVMPVEPPSC